MADVFGECGRQFRGGGFGQFGRLAIDDHQQHVGQLREGGLDRFLILPPRDLGGDQRGGVCGHREMAGGIERRARDQREAHRKHRERPLDAKRDELLDAVRNHCLGASGPVK